MHSLDVLYDLIGQYGIYAVFFLVMVEGDITLLLAGVLAHGGFFGGYSFLNVLLWGTLGGCASDSFAYVIGRGFCETVSRPQLVRLVLTDISGSVDWSPMAGDRTCLTSWYIRGESFRSRLN